MRRCHEELNTQTHRLDVVESMGNELYLYFKLGADKLVARVPFDADRIANSGEETVLHFNTLQCHLFDLETEETLVPKAWSNWRYRVKVCDQFILE